MLNAPVSARESKSSSSEHSKKQILLTEVRSKPTSSRDLRFLQHYADRKPLFGMMRRAVQKESVKGHCNINVRSAFSHFSVSSHLPVPPHQYFSAKYLSKIDEEGFILRKLFI